MRISDWSSDVCSSDLEAIERHRWRGNHYPVCQMRGPQRDIPQTLINNHAIESDADAEAYVTRLHAVRPYLGAVVAGLARQAAQIGRAPCRERVCQYVSISGVAVS